MVRFSMLAAVALMAVIAITGCTGNGKNEEATLKAVIENNVTALQEENVEKYMSTLHPDSQGYARMKAICPQIFQIYDLQHKLIDIKVLDVSGDTARVRTTQEARRIAGPENYRSNRSTMVHTLKKDQGQWKIFQSDQESMENIE
ncbi:MAG: nuclear transport factor 2 family protein [Thermodesulfobacteriota bacterium]